MSEESDDPDSSDSSSRQKMFTAAGMTLCVIQFAFFMYMILMFMEMDFAQGFKFMLLAYSSAFIYKNMENSGIIRFVARNWWRCRFKFQIHTFYTYLFWIFLFFQIPLIFPLFLFIFTLHPSINPSINPLIHSFRLFCCLFARGPESCTNLKRVFWRLQTLRQKKELCLINFQIMWGWLKYLYFWILASCILYSLDSGGYNSLINRKRDIGLIFSIRNLFSTVNNYSMG